MASEDNSALDNLSALESSLPNADSDNLLLRLPLEIRDQIYEDVFRVKEPLWTLPDSASSGKNHVDLGLLATSRQIKEEAERVFYLTEQFAFLLYNVSGLHPPKPLVSIPLPWSRIQKVMFQAAFKHCKHWDYDEYDMEQCWESSEKKRCSVCSGGPPHHRLESIIKSLGECGGLRKECRLVACMRNYTSDQAREWLFGLLKIFQKLSDFGIVSIAVDSGLKSRLWRDERIKHALVKLYRSLGIFTTCTHISEIIRGRWFIFHPADPKRLLWLQDEKESSKVKNRAYSSPTSDESNDYTLTPWRAE